MKIAGIIVLLILIAGTIVVLGVEGRIVYEIMNPHVH